MVISTFFHLLVGGGSAIRQFDVENLTELWMHDKSKIGPHQILRPTFHVVHVLKVKSEIKVQLFYRAPESLPESWPT